LTFSVIYLQEHLPEDDRNRRPKHVGGYAVYNITNQHISISTCWFSSQRINVFIQSAFF